VFSAGTTHELPGPGGVMNRRSARSGAKVAATTPSVMPEDPNRSPRTSRIVDEMDPCGVSTPASADERTRIEVLMDPARA